MRGGMEAYPSNGWTDTHRQPPNLSFVVLLFVEEKQPHERVLHRSKG
jgi:hypothetical protein